MIESKTCPHDSHLRQINTVMQFFRISIRELFAMPLESRDHWNHPDDQGTVPIINLSHTTLSPCVLFHYHLLATLNIKTLAGYR